MNDEMKQKEEEALAYIKEHPVYWAIIEDAIECRVSGWKLIDPNGPRTPDNMRPIYTIITTG